MHQVALSGSTCQASAAQFASAPSSFEKGFDKEEVVSELMQSWMQRITKTSTIGLCTISGQIETDLSSITPLLVVKPETAIQVVSMGKRDLDVQIEYDIAVRLSPKREYTVDARIVSREKGKPIFIEAEDTPY